MKYLVIGLGSMGKRRVRNLQALGIKDVAGFDTRSDRRLESHEKYGIPVFDNLDSALQVYGPQVFVVSTPPDLHMHYAYYAFERGISCFIEASVVDAEKIKELSEKIKSGHIVMAPSCTMRYFPGPKKVKELIQTNAIGKVLNVNYQTGQYLPDWHPWEKMEDFYVSKRETGAAREIVPFELTWLNDIFGAAKAAACVKAKLTDMPADIDDIYHCLLRYDDNVLVNLTVEVISRPKSTRDMRVLGSEGAIVFSTDSNSVRYINTSMEEWKEYKLDVGTVESQYINPEEPYIAEMKDFVAAVQAKDQSLYPNSLEDDYAILQTLYALEQMTRG
ncbi:MAG: Oxidoreductase-like protein [Candidatus Magasanikbacteria bacterium GW2011_GWC2_45_8]|uniref:Oxidoreductase-like protein n=1 Tax=Candidatus Magasanikbacteria bacterium GW2011_GWC2_45_8 TaxID=1619050 RepID=A0A0G1Q5M5_9BACT|nr:MAG: Oxidoreductase-like protein [Candidatus Magasanikbacteria bacterium GW2011_GWC2_45_8]